MGGGSSDRRSGGESCLFDDAGIVGSMNRQLTRTIYNLQAFVDDLRLLEAPSLEREGKLRVIDRIWRTSVLNGRKLGM